MKSGLIIAKKGYTIEGRSDEVYVNTETPLQKVMKNVSGYLVINPDGSFGSVGDYDWVVNSSTVSSTTYMLRIPYEDGVRYVPQFEGYMDQKANSKRIRLTNTAAGVSAEGDCHGFIWADSYGIVLFALMPHDITNKPAVGSFGYFVQVYYDRVERED